VLQWLSQLLENKAVSTLTIASSCSLDTIAEMAMDIAYGCTKVTDTKHSISTLLGQSLSGFKVTDNLILLSQGHFNSPIVVIINRHNDYHNYTVSYMTPMGFEPMIFAVKGRCPRPLDEGAEINHKHPC
jgi:hypothetical protein